MSGNKVLASNEKVTVLSNPTLPVSTVSSIVASDSTNDGQDILNLNLEGFEDKNPFSGFSEEHLSKLDEFLSSEEAKKILKETSEDDFSPAMAGIDDTEVGGLGNEAANSGGDSLMFDNESKGGVEATNVAATFSDHAYAMPVEKAPKAQAKQSPVTFTLTAVTSPGVTMATTQTVVPSITMTSSPVKAPASKKGSSSQKTKVAITLATASPSASPRKSTRIALRKGAIPAKEEDQEMTEEVKEEETIQQDSELGDSGKNTDTPKGKEKAKGKKEVITEDKPSPTPSRRSTRIGEIEQRELAEKIRQENLQKEKEEMESMKVKGKKGKDEVPTESVVEKKGKKRGPKKKEQANETKEEEMEETEEQEEEEEEEEEEETVTKSPKKNKRQKAKAKKMQKGKKQKNKKTGKQTEEESEVDEDEDDENEPEESDKDVENDDDEEDDDDKPLKPSKKVLKKGVKGKLKSMKKGLKRKAQDEDDEAEEVTPKKAKLKKGKGKQKGVATKGKKTNIKKKGGKGKSKQEDTDESEEEEETTPKKKGKGKNKKEETDEESEEEEETPKKKGKQKLKKGGVTEEQDIKKSSKGKKKGKLAVKKNETPEEGEEEEEKEESPKKRGKLKGKKVNNVEEQQVETKGKKLKKGKLTKEEKNEAEENEDDESPKNKKKNGKITTNSVDSPQKRKRNKDKTESSEQETPAKKKKMLGKLQTKNDESEEVGVKSKKLKKKGQVGSEKVDTDSDGTPLKSGITKKKKKKLASVSKSSDSDDDKPLIVNKSKLKSDKVKEAESSDVKKEIIEKSFGSDDKRQINTKKKVEVIEDKKDKTSENDIMKGKVKQKKKEEPSISGDNKIKKEADNESVEIKKEMKSDKSESDLKRETKVRRDSKEGKNEKDQKHKDLKHGDHEHHKHHKRQDSREYNGNDNKRPDLLGFDHSHNKKRRDSLGSDQDHDRKRHDSLGSDHGHHKKRHDSLGSDHSHDRSVKNSESKERSKSTEDPDDKNAEHISAARRKSRKSEEAVVVDPTVIDLFKPDDVVLHHEGAEMDKRERSARKKRKTFGQDFEEGSVDGEESGEEVVGFEDDENDSDWDPPDVLYCICKQPHGNRFMIGCDKCENWYHGTCVGISRARGREMEKNNEEYTCPVCAEKEKKEQTSSVNEKGDNIKHEEIKDKAQKIKSESQNKDEKHRKSTEFDKSKNSGNEKTRSHHVKGQSSSDSDRSLTKLKSEEKLKSTSSSQEKMKIPHKEKSSKTENKDDKKGSETSSDKEGKPLLGSIHASKTTTEDKKKRFKSLKEKHSSLPCIGPGCKQHARVGSVYCSSDCIIKHTKESLKIIHRQQEKQVTKSPKGESSEKKIVVLEKKSGRIITGPTAPTESNLVSWLEEHPTFEVLCPKPSPSLSKHDKDKERSSSKDKHRHKDHHKDKSSKEEEKKEEKKEEGPDPVRLNVRKSLRDALARRSEDADDVMLSSSEMKRIALTIEEELFKLFKETGHKYKSRYRSLIFNIKDTKNKGLFRKILRRNIKPYDLVRMNPEELASKELARWREEEAKHTLELIESTEKEHMNEHQHIRKKTHKGEIEIEEDDLSTLEDGDKATKPQLPTPAAEHKGDIMTEFIADTTDQHKNHLFDLNCKICTGKVAPPVEETPVKKGVVTKTEAPKKKEVKVQETKTEEEQLKAEEVVKEVLKAIKKAKEEQQAMASTTADSTVTVRSPDSALQSGLEKKPKFTPSGPQLWKGFVFMQDVAKFVTTAYKVSGPAEKLDLPDTIHICGRIAPDLVFDYVEKMKKIGSKEICILRFIPGNAEEKTAYINMYSYLNSRSRCGVVGNHAKHIKDFYILPLASHSKIPSVLKPFDGPGLEENRPHMLLALIVKQKSKRHNSDKSDGSSSSSHLKHEPYEPTEIKKPKLSASKNKSSTSSSSSSTSSSTSSSASKTHTPPTTVVDKHIRPPSFYNPISSKHSSKKDKGKLEEKRLSPSSMICATNISSSDAQFPPEQVPEDPIVQVYGEDDETTAGGSPYSPSKASEQETNDAPYDPEDDELYTGKKMKPSKTAAISGSKTTTTTTSAAGAASSSLISKVPKSLNISQTIEQIAKTSNPAEATAMMVAALASANSIKDKQRLLKELTDKVEMKKKMLAKAKEKAAESNIQGKGVGTLSSPVTPTSKSALTGDSGNKVVSFETSVSVTESKKTPVKISSPATSVSSTSSSVQATSSKVSITSSSQSVTTKTAVTKSELKALAASTVKKDTVNSNMENIPDSSSSSSLSKLSSDFQMPDRTDKTSSDGMEEETSKILPGSSKKKINIKINLDKSKLEKAETGDKSEKDFISETKSELDEPRKVVSADSLPCALKSLLSSIPGSYSHFSNIRDTSQKEIEEKPKVDEGEVIPFVDEDNSEDKNTLEGGVRVDVGSNMKKPKTKKKKDKEKSKNGKGFNLSLLAFDYGESDSEGEAGGNPGKGVESESESESEGQVSEEEMKLEKPIAPLPKGVFGTLAPPPLPEGAPPDPVPPETPPMPPPLPPEEPPPLPDTPEETEEKKSKKVKPPPEIVLRPMDPIGAAILEATYKKIQKEMTVPAPPMPPLQMLSSTPVQPPTMPQGGILPTSMSAVQQVMPQIGMSGIPESSMPIVSPSGVPHVAQSVMPMMQQSGVPRLPKGGLPPMAQRNMPQSGSSPQGLVQDMPPKGKLNSRGRGFRPGQSSKKIPSLFDVEVKPSKSFGFVDETEDEFPSLDQDLRQAKDLDLRKLDVDERKMAWQKAINPQFQTAWPEDVDHRHGDFDHRHGKNPILPDSLQEETSLPPLPMDLHVQDSDFRQYSALQEDSDMRKVSHKRETKKHDNIQEDHLDVDLRIHPGKARSYGEDEHLVKFSSAINPNPPNYGGEEKGPKRDNLKKSVKSLLPPHLISAPDIQTGSPKLESSPLSSADEAESKMKDIDARRKDAVPPPPLPPTIGFSNVTKTPLLPTPPSATGPRMSPPVQGVPPRGSSSSGHPIKPPPQRLPSRPQPAPPGVDDWD